MKKFFKCMPMAAVLSASIGMYANGTVPISEESSSVEMKKSFAKNFDNEKGFYWNALKSEMSVITADTLSITTYTVPKIDTKKSTSNREESAIKVFQKKSGTLLLNLLNSDSKDVIIRVFDSKNRVVFSEKRKNEKFIEKAFNFDKAYADEYTVEVKDSKNIYYADITVN